MLVSTRPPTIPAKLPKNKLKKTTIVKDRQAIISELEAPYKTRLNKSLPK
ncbi:hypothetical protein LM600918_180008 [Listeria monocytogenes]|nr:hypothetical protein LM600918_180008 [Listeria monocytogenes]